MDDVKAAGLIIKEKIEPSEIALVLGSGLGVLTEEAQGKKEIFYSEIPGFAKSTVPGHEGKLVSGEIEGKKVLILSGRIHYYEGHPMEKIAFMIDTLAFLGVKKLIITNAGGSLWKKHKIPSLMLLKDHINFMGANPLRGGPHFIDMSDPYNEELRKKVKKVAKKLKIKLKEGVYIAVSGPSYETKAEIKMFRKLGADVVGMSTVPEVIAARKNNQDVIGISCLTNYACGVVNKPLSHEEVIESGRIIASEFIKLIKGILREVF
ncbi:MAG: purine-nucleoside phosphorylase [Elusimicrobia bacterium]|nr:purine-nucleoside phosphorylase [Elusimicrobiota bacterium]